MSDLVESSEDRFSCVAAETDAGSLLDHGESIDLTPTKAYNNAQT